MSAHKHREHLNGIRHPQPGDPSPQDARRDAWRGLLVWRPWLTPFTASDPSTEAQQRRVAERVLVSFDSDEPPQGPLDLVEERERFRLLYNAAERCTTKRSIHERQADQTNIQRNLGTFWMTTDPETALALLHTSHSFAPTRSVEALPHTRERDVVLLDEGERSALRTGWINSNGFWAGMRRGLFAVDEATFARTLVQVSARIESVSADPAGRVLLPGGIEVLRASYAYLCARDPSAGHALVDELLSSREYFLVPELLYGALTDLDRARRLYAAKGVGYQPSGVSAWIDAAEAMGPALLPLLETIAQKQSMTFPKSKLWSLQVACEALAPPKAAKAKAKR